MKLLIITILLLFIVLFGVAIYAHSKSKENFFNDILKKEIIEHKKEKLILDQLANIPEINIIRHSMTVPQARQAAQASQGIVPALPEGVPEIAIDMTSIKELKLFEESYSTIDGIEFIDNQKIVPYLIKLIANLQKQLNNMNTTISDMAKSSSADQQSLEDVS